MTGNVGDFCWFIFSLEVLFGSYNPGIFTFPNLACLVVLGFWLCHCVISPCTTHVFQLAFTTGTWVLLHLFLVEHVAWPMINKINDKHMSEFFMAIKSNLLYEAFGSTSHFHLVNWDWVVGSFFCLVSWSDVMNYNPSSHLMVVVIFFLKMPFDRVCCTNGFWGSQICSSISESYHGMLDWSSIWFIYLFIVAHTLYSLRPIILACLPDLNYGTEGVTFLSLFACLILTYIFWVCFW